MRLPLLPLVLLFLAAPLTAQPCDPAQTPEVCPDTTDWRRYFPLEVGNAWQYECDGFCTDDYDRAFGRQVVSADVAGADTLFAVRTCDFRGSGEIRCRLTEGLRYDEGARLVVKEEADGELYDYLLACDLGMPFNVKGDYECGVESFLEQWFSFGSYGAALPLPGPRVNGTFKSIGNIGGGAEYLAGVGPTRLAGDATSVDYPIAYARVGGVEYGEPVFGFPGCDPQQTTVPCADTTAWRSYFPLAVGNAWQYECQRDWGECEGEGERDFGFEIVGAEGGDFLLRRCEEAGTGGVACGEPVRVRYDEDARVVAAELDDYLGACDLGAPFNTNGFYQCSLLEALPLYTSGDYNATYHADGRHGGAGDVQGHQPQLQRVELPLRPRPRRALRRRERVRPPDRLRPRRRRRVRRADLRLPDGRGGADAAAPDARPRRLPRTRRATRSPSASPSPRRSPSRSTCSTRSGGGCGRWRLGRVRPARR